MPACSLDFPHAHAAGVLADDVVTEAGHPALVFRHQRRLEAAKAVARDRQMYLAPGRPHPLLAAAVAVVVRHSVVTLRLYNYVSFVSLS